MIVALTSVVQSMSSERQFSNAGNRLMVAEDHGLNKFGHQMRWMRTQLSIG